MGLHNLIWAQEVKILAFLGLPLHRNGFDNKTSFRSFLLAPASPVFHDWTITAVYLALVNWVIELI